MIRRIVSRFAAYCLIAAGGATIARADIIIQSDALTDSRSGSAGVSGSTQSYNVSGNGSSSVSQGNASASGTNSVTLAESTTSIAINSSFSSSVSSNNASAGASSDTEASGRIFFRVTTSGTYALSGSALLSVTPSSPPFSANAPYIDFEQRLSLYDVDDDQDLYASNGIRTYTGGTADVSPPPPSVSLVAGTLYELLLTNYGISNTNGAPSSLTGSGTAQIRLSAAAAVPAPASISMLGLGGLVSWLLGRRRRRASLLA